MKKHFLWIVILAFIVIFSCGCSKETEEAPQPDFENCPDYLETTALQNQEYIIFRSTQNFYVVGEEWVILYGLLPSQNMEIGDFARITADVNIWNGGVAGYTGNPEITTLLTMDVLDFNQVPLHCVFPYVEPYVIMDPPAYCLKTTQKFYAVSDFGDYNIFTENGLYRTYENVEYTDYGFIYYNNNITLSEVANQCDKGVSFGEDFFVFTRQNDISKWWNEATYSQK